MVFRMNIYLITAMLIMLIAQKATSAPFLQLDPVDECILICDACFKGQTLLSCANDCLSLAGDVHQHWKNHCSLFDAKVPSVQMI